MRRYRLEEYTQYDKRNDEIKIVKKYEKIYIFTIIYINLNKIYQSLIMIKFKLRIKYKTCKNLLFRIFLYK